MTNPAAAPSATHLIRAVVPTVVEPERALRLSRKRVDSRVLVSEAVGLRIPWLPPPAQRETLAELVQAARLRCREDRVRVEGSELRARLAILGQVLEELQP